MSTSSLQRNPELMRLLKSRSVLQKLENDIKHQVIQYRFEKTSLYTCDTVVSLTEYLLSITTNFFSPRTSTLTCSTDSNQTETTAQVFQKIFQSKNISIKNIF